MPFPLEAAARELDVLFDEASVAGVLVGALGILQMKNYIRARVRYKIRRGSTLVAFVPLWLLFGHLLVSTVVSQWTIKGVEGW